MLNILHELAMGRRNDPINIEKNGKLTVRNFTILVGFIAMMSPSFLFASEKWKPLHDTSCEADRPGTLQLTATLAGILEDSVRANLYEIIGNFNCLDKNRKIVIKYDQSSNRTLVLNREHSFYIGREFDRNWTAPPETDVLIFVANQIDIGSAFMISKAVSEFVSRNEHNLEKRYEVFRYLFNNGEKCRYIAGGRSKDYEVVLLDADLKFPEIKSCIRRLYR